MDIIRHESTTRELGAPKTWDQTESECVTLPIVDVPTPQGNAMISFWKPSHEELAELNANGVIELWVFGKNHHPVVSIAVRTEGEK